MLTDLNQFEFGKFRVINTHLNERLNLKIIIIFESEKKFENDHLVIETSVCELLMFWACISNHFITIFNCQVI